MNLTEEQSKQAAQMIADKVFSPSITDMIRQGFDKMYMLGYERGLQDGWDAVKLNEDDKS